MKKLLLASSAAASLICWVPAVMAGDLNLAPSSYDWSGGYVGANAGAALNNTQLMSNFKYVGQSDPGEETLALIDDLDYSNTADDIVFSGGILAGYNWQMSGIVFGVEGDYNYLGFSGSETNDVSDVMSQVMEPQETTASEKIHYESNWFGTVRARVGYAMSNVLIYGTGGLAYGEMDVSQKLAAENSAESALWKGSTNGWNLGWTAGGGVEYAVDRWVLGAEYLYVDLGSYDWSSMGNVALTDPILDTDWSEVKQSGEADLSFSVARATLKYRF
jgi:outer membrane immunogenic protein